MTTLSGTIDLHMHTTVSDGTDTPEELLLRVREAGIGLFSITDHDAIDACKRVLPILKRDDPAFITGVEFSCKDVEGQYHILGYGYDPDAEAINGIVRQGHAFRMQKITERLAFLKERFGFIFSEEDVDRLLEQPNPGKPHVANLMVQYGYAKNRDEAIKAYINEMRADDAYVRPEDAIRGISASGGVAVLAHPAYGRGDELIVGDALTQRVCRLIGFGLSGVEAFYSGFTEKLRQEVLHIAECYDLYVTAGSDYHGKNKLIAPGDTGMDGMTKIPEGLIRFLKKIEER